MMTMAFSLYMISSNTWSMQTYPEAHYLNPFNVIGMHFVLNVIDLTSCRVEIIIFSIIFQQFLPLCLKFHLIEDFYVIVLHRKTAF